ncbi:transposase [Flavicella sediminum]
METKIHATDCLNYPLNIGPNQMHYDSIANFFNNRSTNAAAESFNAKIKDFRRSFRGVTDIKFFLFRLANIYA